MPDRFRLDVALYIADAASVGRKVAYGELCAKFGGASNDWGTILTVMARRLRERGYPLLPVMVVTVDTGLPNKPTCRQLALVGEDTIRLEQQRCFEFDWQSAFFQPQKSFGTLPHAMIQVSATPVRDNGIPQQSSDRNDAIMAAGYSSAFRSPAEGQPPAAL